MGRGLQKPVRRYELNQSPLYALSTKRKLAELLGWNGTPNSLDSFASRADNYIQFTTPDGRDIQTPKPQLERIQRRIANLLVRVAIPNYLHSGVRGRSYVSNGQQHVNPMPAIKVDVKKFYPSTSREHIYRWFSQELKCSRDVAGVLTTLSCFDQRCLPTGSPLSQILAFHVHRRMFDSIEAYVAINGGVLTVYVDDISISMPQAGWGTIRRVGKMIERQGLQWHKARAFRQGMPKLITGTVAKANHLEAPNQRHMDFRAAMDAYEATTVVPGGGDRELRRALGLLESIGQVDLRRRPWVRGVRPVLYRLRGAATVDSLGKPA